MSKIFEALQNARRQKIGKEASALAVPVPFAPPEPAGFGLEDEMLTLFKMVEILLPLRSSKIVQFIGANQGEGTSTIIREFARVSADLLGHSVLLVDTDRHYPCQELFFDIQNSFGWLDALKSGGHCENAFHRVGQSKLFLSPGSNSAVATPEIFSSKFDSMCENFRSDFDIVLIDSAPLTLSPDGLAIASKVDGVIMVVEAESTRWQTAKRLKESVLRVGGNVLGVVLNKKRYYIPEAIYKHL